jgi:hypothetical protein
MKNTATVQLIRPERAVPTKRRQLKKKIKAPLRALENLLLFDSHCIDVVSRQELLRLLPQLVGLRRAWKAHFLEYGCLHCPKPDPTVGIAARLRQRGSTWADVYKITGTPAEPSPERERFRESVRWRMTHPDVPRPRPSNQYGAGGFCSVCQTRIYTRMQKRFRRLVEGRSNETEVAAFKDALCLSYNLAQRIFHGDE